ncbi:FecR family protein [Alteromonadaceae bacterium BrNp21-10]|nr:FecR family protein [Alteromonadaceae bacterium BrNp21-10]
MRILFVVLFLSGLALPLAAIAQDSAGKTIMASGKVNANAENQIRALKRRSPVFAVDVVSTGLASATQLRMIDGGLLSIQEQSELAIANYEFNPATQDGSVTMSLLKGGLRTITGALHTRDNNYRLNTPVASIGVRGTHYEAEMLEDDLYLAGWQGIIDVAVSVPGKGQRFSLGPDQAYRFAVVRVNGDVEFLLNVPPAFSEGHSNALQGDMTLTDSTADISASEFDDVSPLPALGLVTNDQSGKEFIDNDRLVANWVPDTLDGLRRTGSATFDNLAQHSISSSNGQLTNLNLSMQINFDNATVPTGDLSFTDNGGEWFAVFNGFVSDNSLDLNINFASHGNDLADGALGGVLIDDASSILGELELHEVDDTSVSVDGGFLLMEKP